MENINIKKNDDRVELNFEGDLTIQQSQELKAVLTEQLNQNRQILINLENLKQIDLSGLQLLMAAGKSAASQNKELSFKQGEIFMQNVRNAALESYFKFED